MDFMNLVENTLNNQTQLTENGAVGYRTTGSKLVDMNFKASSMRNMTTDTIENMFFDAFIENRMLAFKWMFYLRDAREGMGERNTFRKILVYMAKQYPELVKAIIPLIPEYGRFDDVIELLDTPVEKEAVSFIQFQLEEDMENMKEGKPISLCAKWLPSVNTSSTETRKKAKKLVKAMGIKESEYRKMLSSLRKQIGIVETMMSAKKFDSIVYENVPSKANIKYRNAFLKRDSQRRQEYLSKALNGEVKMNSTTNFPYDIVNAYQETYSYWSKVVKEYDPALEALWNNLPDYMNEEDGIMVVQDGSFSMCTRIHSNSRVEAIDVSMALAIYASQRLNGPYKNKYITFSSRPSFVDLSNCKSLKECIELAKLNNDCSNTNIESVFHMILETAIKNHVNQSDLPKRILIISDMEFDGSTYYRVNETLFESIANTYKQHGYKMPRLVFWNVCSRTGTIPTKENELGVTLVSGFSPAVFKMVMSNQTDPYDALVEQLSSPRYDAVEEAIESII